MPNASEAELIEAAENFKQYMVVVRRIYERIGAEHSGHDSRDFNSRGRVTNDTV